MDQVINAARSLGKIIQADDRYVRYMLSQQRSDEDAALQEEIAAFQQVRTQLGEEMNKADKDQAEVDRLNADMRGKYAKIFGNPNMLELTEARNDMESLLTFINQIITGSSNGQDPELIEMQEDCGGSCSSCAGCG